MRKVVTKADGTERVEMAWIAPFRRYAPAVLVVCIGILIELALSVSGHLQEIWRSPAELALWGLVYVALIVLASYLVVQVRESERSAERERAAAAALYGLSERLSTTLESIGEAVIATDLDGVISYVNPAAVRLLNWPAGRVVGVPVRTAVRLVRESDRQPVEDPVQTVLASGTSYTMDTDVLLITRDGREVPVACRAAPVLDAEGWLIGAVLVLEDISGLRAVQRQRERLIKELSEANAQLQAEVARREEGRRAALSLMQDAQMAQAALKESEERLRVLFEGIDDALLVHDESGQILDCNPAALKILGCERDELLKRKITEVLHASGSESELICSDRRRIPVDVHRSEIRYHGKPATLVVARDITELKRIENELRASNIRLQESNEALEEYARVASHDLQEPLRKIENFAQILVEDYGPQLDEKAQQYLDIMVKSARRMRRLIRDVLAFSRSGFEERPFQRVDLKQIVEVALDNLSEYVREKRAEVKVGSLPVVEGDPTQLLQLFQNLIGNALKFNDKAEPKVEVWAEPAPSFWKIFVRDNGIGIRPEDLRVIFTPFKRLHGSEKFEGTGIGLAICRRIVTRHRGEIGVDSELNKGSTFWFTIPRLPEHIAQLHAEAAS